MDTVTEVQGSTKGNQASAPGNPDSAAEVETSGSAGNRILQTIDAIDHIGASPEFIIRIVRLFSDPEADIREISHYISREQSICAQLLRLANSAYFSRGMVISTVSQAMVHLGLNIVKKVVIAFEMFDLFPDRNSGTFEHNQFVKSSIAGAVISEEVSLRMGLKEREEVYLDCLMRDFGVLILQQYFPDIFAHIREIAHQKSCPFPVACSQVCGFDHRYISNLLFQRWNLPSNILSVREQGSAGYSRWVLTENIINYVDWTLKYRNFAQWDPHAEPMQCGPETFTIDEKEINAAINQRLMEVDEFMLMLANGMGEKAA